MSTAEENSAIMSRYLLEYLLFHFLARTVLNFLWEHTIEHFPPIVLGYYCYKKIIWFGLVD